MLALLFAGTAFADAGRARPRSLAVPARGHDDRADGARRAEADGAFSTGPGGPLLILNETLIGAIGEGIIAAPVDAADLGGVVLKRPRPRRRGRGLPVLRAGRSERHADEHDRRRYRHPAGLAIGSYASITDASLTGLLVLGGRQLGAFTSYASATGSRTSAPATSARRALGAYTTLFSLLAVQAFTAAAPTSNTGRCCSRPRAG